MKPSFLNWINLVNDRSDLKEYFGGDIGMKTTLQTCTVLVYLDHLYHCLIGDLINATILFFGTVICLGLLIYLDYGENSAKVPSVTSSEHRT